MIWKARPGCLLHYQAAVKRMVNTLPLSYLLLSVSGELFDSLEHCNRRLRGWAFAEGFDIICCRGGIKAVLMYRFKYIFHSNVTRNDRKLKNTVEKNLKGKIISRYKKKVINVC
jgi:hypothetical protein